MENSQESFIKFISLMKSWSRAPTSQDSNKFCQEILHKLAYCENASKKTQEELKALREEIVRDQKTYREVGRRLSALRTQLRSKRRQYLKAKMYRKNVIKANLIGELIRDFPPCSILKSRMVNLECEIKQLEEKSKLLTAKLMSIQKQVNIMENLTFFTSELVLEPECD